jgi:hypothetical protein
VQVARFDLLTTVAADEHSVQVLPACVAERRRRRVDGPLVTPGAQCLQDEPQVAAGFGEFVLVAGRMLAVLVPRDHARGLERTQPGGEPVAGGARVTGDRVEALVPEADLTHGEQRPLLADQVQCGGHRARAAGEIVAHGRYHTRLRNQTH